VGRETDDDVWRVIVENYGERAELDDDPPLDVLPSGVESEPEPDADREVRHDRRRTDLPEHAEAVPLIPEDDDRFVPPPPPPLPVVAPDRMLAWVGLFGSPTILLLALILGVALPPWLGYLLVAGFLGGFGYLVVKMPRGPADPWDDGARL
jgi:hypothetical protein